MIPLPESWFRNNVENIDSFKHSELSWQVRVSLIADLHDLRILLNGKALNHRPKGTKGWGIRDTARELGLSVGIVSESLKIHQALRNHPDLLSVKAFNQVKKVLRILEGKIE